MRLIRKILVKASLLFVVFIFVSCSHRSDTSQDNKPLPVLPFARELQDALNHALRSSQGDYDLGISAAVIVSGYELWSGASGYSHRGVSITPDMLFDAGSIAKNFEAALVLKMTEERLINLDDPLSKSLPVYRNVDRDITIRQLLNHTSGVFNVFEHPEFPWVGPDVDYSKKWKMEEVFNTFVLAPYGPPGLVQHYSSTNYLLLTSEWQVVVLSLELLNLGVLGRAYGRVALAVDVAPFRLLAFLSKD